MGLTQEYRMENGIDQGEIMSPLLWIIYYDPLFTKIKRIKGLGYTMSHHWKSDLALNKMEKILVEIYNAAFMDDTTWIAFNQNSLLQQLIIADSFNRFTGIDVNPFKSKLITINRTNNNIYYVIYGQREEKIYSLKPSEFTHF